jgi:hypothetical protein
MAVWSQRNALIRMILAEDKVVDLETEIERYRQRSRDEDTVRIRLNHARIETRDALSELITFAEEHVRLSYRDADVPQMLADPILKRARSVLEG